MTTGPVQMAFARALAAETGLSYQASLAWASAEVGGNNNLGIMAGPGQPASFATPAQGAAAAAALINSSPLYAGIRASVGSSPAAQMDAIARSPWHLGPSGLKAAGGLDPYYARVFSAFGYAGNANVGVGTKSRAGRPAPGVSVATPTASIMTPRAALPSDPLSRANVYIANLKAAQAAGKTVSSTGQSIAAELAHYQAVASGLSAAKSSSGANPTPAPSVSSTPSAQQLANLSFLGLTYSANPTADQLALLQRQGWGYGPGGLGTAAQQALVDAGNQYWVSPGETAPRVSSLSTSGLAFVAGGGLGAKVSASDLAAAKTAYAADRAVSAQKAALTSTGGGVGTPVTAGAGSSGSAGTTGSVLGAAGNASPYVPTLDNSGLPASVVSGGAGQAMGSGWTVGGGSSGVPITYVLAGAAVLGLLYLSKGKKGGKLL